MEKQKLHRAIAALMIGGVLLGSAGTSSAFAKQVSSKAKINISQSLKSQKAQSSAQNQASRENEIKTQLDALVTAGTITQDQEDKIIASYKEQESQRQAEMDKIKNMTEAERKTYFESKSKESRPDLLGDLVTAGTITQAQADALKNIFEKGHRGPGMPGDKGPQDPAAMESNMKSKLDSLVTAGTITQDQEDKVVANFKDQKAQRQAEMEKVKNMTEAERKAYFESKSKETKSEPFADLVSAGTITQAQADAIKNVLESGHGGPGMHGDRGQQESAATN